MTTDSNSNSNSNNNTDSSVALQAAIEAMTGDEPCLYDVTIICTTDDHQADFWMKRLSEGVCRRRSFPEKEKEKEKLFPMVLAVSEDWSNPGGAGNGLGTLYAFQKASALAKQVHDLNLDLAELLRQGKISAALYHTAGKGTRMAPLPASENNNKPGVKLPCCLEMSDGTWEPITVLEAVVKQTGVYAPSRLGRLSVFWGDQVFIPSAPYVYTPTHHVDIMCTLLGDTAPTAEEWEAKGLDKYGVIAVSATETKNAAQVEKVNHATAVKMLESLGDIGQVGPSLGSFSVSAAILDALIREFEPELSRKEAKLDTDPHFWMPLTLPRDDYATLMETKGTPKEESLTHHDRMSKMKESFFSSSKTTSNSNENNTMGLFGAVNVGSDAAWWDFGLLKLYMENALKLLQPDANAQLLRQFLGLSEDDKKTANTTLADGVQVDDESRLADVVIGNNNNGDSGDSKIEHSVLAAVRALQVQANGAVICNVSAPKIVAGKGAVLYNLVSPTEPIVAGDGDVLVGVTDEEGTQMVVKSHLDLCGKKHWSKAIQGNSHSFEEIHALNHNANVTVISQKRRELFQQTSSSFGLLPTESVAVAQEQ